MRAGASAICQAKRYVYFWVDGIHVQARLEDTAQCLLVIIGATPEGKKELVGLIDGVRESAQSWKELLLDLKRRGLAMAPELAVADDALGFWQAIEEVWPQTRGQRCWVHKTANQLEFSPKLEPPRSITCAEFAGPSLMHADENRSRATLFGAPYVTRIIQRTRNPLVRPLQLSLFCNPLLRRGDK